MFDTVLVAVGGGGLIAGIATAIGDRAQVVGVEPELAPTLQRALEAGELVDGRSAGWRRIRSARGGSVRWPSRPLRRYDVRSVLVDEEAIVAARNELWREYHLAAEHGARRRVRRSADWRLQPAQEAVA